MRLNETLFDDLLFDGQRAPEDPLYLWGILGSFIYKADDKGVFIDDDGNDRSNSYTWDLQGGDDQYNLSVKALDLTQDSDMYQFTRNNWTTISTNVVNGIIQEGTPPPYAFMALMPNYSYASQGNQNAIIGGTSSNDFIVLDADGVTIQE
jgi:hypothetical protein